MAINVIGTIGTCVAVSAALPATEDQAGYEALTWTEWAPCTQIGDLGGVDQVIEMTPTCDGITRKINGARNNGSQAMEGGFDPLDPGQVILEAAYGARSTISVRLTYITGDVRYYTGVVTSGPETPGSAGDVVMYKPNFEISSPIVKIAAP